MRRRIWSELLPLEEVRAPGVLRLLSRYGLELAIAVRPETAPGLGELLRACAGAGVRVAVWPMIADEAGRWASAGNAGKFWAFVLEVIERLAAEEITAGEVVFDLEPPLPLLRGALGGLKGALQLLGAKMDLGAGERAYGEIARGLGARGIEASAAIVPLLLLDSAERGWERCLGTPAEGVGWGRVHVMLYTSILEGWSRGLLRRADALALLGWGCRAARRRFGEAAGVSLGAVGVGALGDEPVYRAVQELREDVAAARAAGIEDLALFDLGGILARPPAEAWIEALVATPPAPAGAAALPPRAKCALAAARVAQIARRAAGPW
jgi:hypothetical protein